MPEVVKHENVSLWRRDTTILQNINWTISLGQHWVILGSNGVGKATLADMPAGRACPSQSSVRTLDEALGRVEVARIRQRVGYSSPVLAVQIPGIKTVSQVMFSAVWGVTVSGRETCEDIDRIRADSLMELFEIITLRQRRFDTLSQGEKQRVIVARALMIDPETLILDEPATALDLGGRKLLLEGLAELARDPKSPAMVMATHYLEETPPGFTRVLALKDGETFAVGPINRVLTSTVLTQMYGLQLDITQFRGRYSVKLSLAWGSVSHEVEENSRRKTQPSRRKL